MGTHPQTECLSMRAGDEKRSQPSRRVCTAHPRAAADATRQTRPCKHRDVNIKFCSRLRCGKEIEIVVVVTKQALGTTLAAGATAAAKQATSATSRIAIVVVAKQRSTA